MAIVCGFRSIQEMASSVNSSAQRIEGKRFSPRPWNRFEPENTDWWIVPLTDWPAYRFGKGMFRSVEYSPGQVLICLNVEKGFAPIVGKAFPELVSRGQVMDGNWAWFNFLAGLEDGSVARASQALEQEISSELILEISALYPSNYENFEPYILPLRDTYIDEECRSPEDAGLIWFKVAGEELKRLGERCVGETVAPVANCHGLVDLANALQTSPKLPWTWIDISIGVLVSLLSGAQKPSDYWGPSHIWDKLFRPWLRWMA